MDDRHFGLRTKFPKKKTNNDLHLPTTYYFLTHQLKRYLPSKTPGDDIEPIGAALILVKPT
jgi:hypothetical protein